MTGALHYHSLDEFERDYIEALSQELEAMAGERAWWREAPSIAEDPQRPYRLVGSSRLLRRYLENPDGQLQKIDYRDDMLMAMSDYMAIVEMLTYLSHEHEFDWSLGSPTDSRPKEIGRIEHGAISPHVFEFLLPEMEALNISDSDLSDTAIHSRVRSKYAPPQKA